MSITVAVYAQGEMGAGVARRLTENGVRALTVLDGRSEASRQRAARAGMEAAAWSDLASADIFLSIVPPGFARPLAEKMAQLWASAGCAPVFVDCNAVSPASVRGISALFERTEAPFVDAGIIGGPPKSGSPGPTFYACGAGATRFADLAAFGLEIEVLTGSIGTASALKMSYGGITKGMTAILAAMAGAAERSGATAALKREFTKSQPALSSWAARQVPGMIPKAYRWVDEMREVARFQEDEVGADLYEAIARFYERIARDESEGKPQTATLRDFFG
jgi:putative dehydrogenase